MSTKNSDDGNIFYGAKGDSLLTSIDAMQFASPRASHGPNKDGAGLMFFEDGQAPVLTFAPDGVVVGSAAYWRLWLLAGYVVFSRSVGWAEGKKYNLPGASQAVAPTPRLPKVKGA